MITSVEARVNADGSLQGALYFEGDRKDVVYKFRKPGSGAIADSIISGITHLPETIVRFSELVGPQGVRDIHELMVDNGANQFAQDQWQSSVYPTVAGRLAGFR